MGLGELINNAQPKSITLGGEEQRNEWRNLEEKSFKLSELGTLSKNVKDGKKGELKSISKDQTKSTKPDDSILGSVYDQLNPGQLTPNIGQDLGDDYLQFDPGYLTSNIGNNKLTQNQINQLPAGQLTPNIGKPLGEEYEQMNPGELTNNIDNKLIKKNDIKQLKPGVLTSNIGKDLGILTEEPEEVETPDLGSAFQQTFGELTPNIGNDLDVSYKQPKLGKVETTKDLGVEFKMKNLDKLTSNIGGDIGDAYEQDAAGIPTKNIVNDIEPLYTNPVESDGIKDLGESYKQPELIEKEEDLGVKYKQENAGELTPNILENDLEVFKQPEFEHKTEKVEPLYENPNTIKDDKLGNIDLTTLPERERKLDVVFDQPNFLNKNGENDLDILFDNEPIKPKNEDLGIQFQYEEPDYKNPRMGKQYNQTDAGEVSSNVKADKKLGKMYPKEEDKEERKNTKPLYKNPLPKNRPDKFDLKNIEEVSGKDPYTVESIERSIRTNKGNDLGNVYKNENL